MRKARIDTTATALTALARQMGAKVLLLNGAVDALMLYRGRLLLVDFKTVRGKRMLKTQTQKQLLLEGWPLHFLATPADVETLLWPDQMRARLTR